LLLRRLLDYNTLGMPYLKIKLFALHNAGLRFLRGHGDFSLRLNVQSGFGVHSASYEEGTKYFFLSVAARTYHYCSKFPGIRMHGSVPPLSHMPSCHEAFNLLAPELFF